jgi:hypothetical protein
LFVDEHVDAGLSVLQACGRDGHGFVSDELVAFARVEREFV